MGQNGINSPYTRYGVGQLSEGALGINKAMGGTGYALRSNTYINLMNPAAISAVDSLTFMMDAGYTMQNVNFEERDIKMNTKNSAFDYIALQFRVIKDLGLSVGFLPYSNVGYSFKTSEIFTDPDDNTSFTSSSSYNGDGGLHQIFMGTGYRFGKNLSAGLMFSYLYGDITHTVTHSFSESSIYSRAIKYSTSISSYKFDMGLQYSFQLNGGNTLTTGLTYSLGHKLGADAQKISQLQSSGSVISGDTVTEKNVFKLPHTIGIGFAYQTDDKWTFALDYTWQNWGDVTFFSSQKGYNRSKIALGVEYYPNAITSRNLLKRMRYRAGAYYSTPYIEVEGKKGPYEYGFSAGFAIPVLNRYNNKSWINVSGQYARVKPTTGGLIGETYLRLNIGVSFNESWFFKRKVN